MEAQKAPAQQADEPTGVADAAASTLPEHAASSGVLAEEDDLLHAVLGGPPHAPLGIASDRVAPPSSGTEPAAVRMPAAADVEELGGGMLHSGGSAAAEHDIESMLEDMLVGAADPVEAAPRTLTLEPGTKHLDAHAQLASLQDRAHALGMGTATQDPSMQQAAWHDNVDEAQPRLMEATGADLRSTSTADGGKLWADMEDMASINGIIEALLQATITDGSSVD